MKIKNLVLIVLFISAGIIFFSLTRRILTDMFIENMFDNPNHMIYDLLKSGLTINNIATIITLIVLVTSISLTILINYFKYKRNALDIEYEVVNSKDEIEKLIERKQ